MNKNVNRDYLVKVNVKTAEIETPKDDMIFYVTDIWTSNIFFQLDFGKGNSLTDLHNENASDYDLTLRVVKPNKEHKELKASLLSQDSNFFVADLKPDFTDYIGICECELFIETTINGRKETNTTDPFEYIVEGSVFSALDEVIEGNPDYPLVDTLATKEYVDAAVAAGVGSGIDLSGYVTTESMNTALAGKSDTGHTHTDLHTHSNKDVLDSITAEKVASWDSNTGSSVDLSGYVTTEAMNTALSGKSNTNHTHDTYATKSNPYFTGIISGNNCKVAIGEYVESTGSYSNAQGRLVEASGSYSYAQGLGYEVYNDTTESWDGFYVLASGIASHAEGYGTQAKSNYQHVQGKFNIPDTANKYAHIVGNGVDNGSYSRPSYSNAHTLDWDGNGWYKGNLYVGGTNQDNANKVLSTADIKFTSDGKLSVTINGVTKKFNPA